MNTFLNTHTNIIGLQYGRDKCVKMHIGKKHNKDKYSDCEVDAWGEEVIQDSDGHDTLKDMNLGKEIMNKVFEEKNI